MKAFAEAISQEPGLVVGVCMDGACTAAFPIIREEVPHVFTQNKSTKMTKK